MKLSSRIITAILLIAGSSGAVYAFGKHSDWGMSPEEKVEFVTDRVTKKLNLDSQQQQNFMQLAEKITGIMVEMKATRAAQMTELDGLLQDPNFDETRALELVQQKTRTINEKAPMVIASLATFLDSLNSEQKQQLQEFMRHQHRHHRHGSDHDS